MKEKLIENKIKSYLNSKNIYFFKHHGNKFSKVGVPDIIACHNGKFIGIEVKNEIGKTTVLQDLNLEQIKQSGGIAIIARSLDDVKRIIE